MYKLMLVTNQPEVLHMVSGMTDLRKQGFSPITVAGSVQEAIDMLDSKPVDAIGYALDKQDESILYSHLLRKRPSLPIFQVFVDDAAQRESLLKLRRHLDRMHEDAFDEAYDEEAMLEIVRDEMAKDLLSGAVKDEATLRERMMLVRSRVDIDKPCVVFDIDMPQGEVYMQDRWHYGRERLESALRNNFFGRVEDGVLYHVVVLTQRNIRLLACQPIGSELATQKFAAIAKVHTNLSIQNVKEYLGLDMEINKILLLDNFAEMLKELGK